MEGNEINKIVVEAYSSASKALKSVRKESGVTIDSVESAMEMFQDEVIILFSQIFYFSYDSSQYC